VNCIKYLKHRQEFSTVYPTSNRQKEYNKILSGYWYFKS